MLAGDEAESRFSLAEGETAYLVLTHGEDQEEACIDDFAGAQRRLETTTEYWRRWTARSTYRGAYRDAVMRSALCLKLLTYSPSGAIVAAATAGLPEAVPGDRNYDYRFTWMRDAAFTVTAFVMLGYVREASEFLRFLREGTAPTAARPGCCTASPKHAARGGTPPPRRLERRRSRS